MVNKLNKAFYNTVLSQAFSPCGNYLIIGDIYGKISVFHLWKLVNQDANTQSIDFQQPTNTFIVREDVQINSLETTPSFLIIGTVGEIYGYSWDCVLKSSKKAVCSWTIEIPNNNDNLDKPEVNCLAFHKENLSLYAGCGNNNIHVFDIESRKNTKNYKKHKGYVHCLSLSNNNIISGAEDGMVLIWDAREKNFVNKIKPNMNEKVARPDVGKWIGGVGLNEDWLLCGGGPRLSLWHLRSMNVSTVFPIDDKGIHVAKFNQDKIFAGGRSDFLYQMSYNGDIITEIPTSSVTTYSAIHQDTPFQALCIAGSSPKIDICANFMYKSLQLTLN